MVPQANSDKGLKAIPAAADPIRGPMPDLPWPAPAHLLRPLPLCALSALV